MRFFLGGGHHVIIFFRECEEKMVDFHELSVFHFRYCNKLFTCDKERMCGFLDAVIAMNASRPNPEEKQELFCDIIITRSVVVPTNGKPGTFDHSIESTRLDSSFTVEELCVALKDIKSSSPEPWVFPNAKVHTF